MTKDITALTKRVPEDLQPSGYFKDQANFLTGNIFSYYSSHWYNVPPKVTFQDPQNANVQFSNEDLPNQQTSVCSQISPSNLQKN